MSAADNDRMVLRTVYLPTALDQRMKAVAFREDRSKNDIIRELLQAGLEAMAAKDPGRFVEQPAIRRTHPVKLKPVSRTKLGGEAMTAELAKDKVRHPTGNDLVEIGARKRSSKGPAKKAVTAR